MKSCIILYNKPSDKADLDEIDVLDQALFVKKNLAVLDWEVSILGLTDNYYEQIKEKGNLLKKSVAFNLSEAAYGKGELNYFVPALLDAMSYRYAGNSAEALFVTTNKVLTKKMLMQAGVPTPRWCSITDCNSLYDDCRYIVKPCREDASVGIEEVSVLTGKELKAWNKAKCKRYRNCFVEEYIAGREFNVSIISDGNEVRVLPLAEIKFIDFPEDKPQIVGYKAKWDEESFEYNNTVREFNTADEDLKMIIEKTARKCWEIFGLKGYARVDMRISNDNIPYILEINANPCIAPNSGFVAAVNESGMSYEEMFNIIMSDLNND